MKKLYTYILYHKILYKKTLDFISELSNMGVNYITTSKVKNLKFIYEYIYVAIKKSFFLHFFCHNFLKTYESIENIIEFKNQEYINIQKQKYKKFFDNICGYPLDDNQRNAIIIDDDKNLIVAGAGSGKTLTMIGKIHYLISNMKIKEEEILCLSFTNETTKNLRNKLKTTYNYNVDVYTFHKLGYQIIKNKTKNVKIASDNLLKQCIDEYFDKLSKQEITNVFKYFNEFTKIPKSYQTKTNNITLKSICENADETVRDKEEVEIANNLYLRGVSYIYEKTSYGAIFHIKGKKLYYYNFYNPQYCLLCIEKTQDNKITKYDFLVNELDISVEKVLKNHKIESFPLDYEKVYMDMIHNNNDYIVSLKKLLIQFMNIYKTGIKIINDLEDEVKTNTMEFAFIMIFKQIYTIYQNKLDYKNEIDVNDMLLIATKIADENYCYKKYKYILIDEFQDTSLVRYQLIHNIIKHTNAKLIAVGDDFQSIYRFSGCSVDLFINFEKYFGDSKISYIENTYRNSQELIDIAGSFVMKNPNQIKKKLYSNKHIENPIGIHYYDNLSTELLKIINNLSTEKDKVILGRNNNDIYLLNHDDIKIRKDFIYLKKLKENIPYLTVHKSKGLEYDYVFLINMSDNITGFPSKIEEHNILKMIMPKEEEYPFAEERRLFYVALTRAKEKVFILAPRNNPSIFVKEIEILIKKQNAKKQ